jgi:hypothetical protein
MKPASCMALQEPTQLISQNLDDLPFDLKVHRTIPYTLADLVSLQRTLTNAMRQTIVRDNLLVPGDAHRTMVFERNPNETALRQHPTVARLLRSSSWRGAANAAIAFFVYGKECGIDSWRRSSTWKQVESAYRELFTP